MFAILSVFMYVVAVALASFVVRDVTHFIFQTKADVNKELKLQTRLVKACYHINRYSIIAYDVCKVVGIGVLAVAAFHLARLLA